MSPSQQGLEEGLGNRPDLSSLEELTQKENNVLVRAAHRARRKGFLSRLLTSCVSLGRISQSLGLFSHLGNRSRDCGGRLNEAKHEEVL